MVRVGGEHLAEQLALGLVVGGLETADQLEERRQDLLGQLGRDDVLVLAAVGEDGREPLLLAQAEEPLLTEQHVQGGEDRAAGHLDHLGDVERGKAARLTARGIDQADLESLTSRPIGTWVSRSRRSNLACGVACQWRSSVAATLSISVPTGSTRTSIIHG